MTLTAPGCGSGPVLATDVKNQIEDLPDIENMMTEAAKLQLGFM